MMVERVPQSGSPHRFAYAAKRHPHVSLCGRLTALFLVLVFVSTDTYVEETVDMSY